MKNIFLLPTDQPSRLVEDLNGVFSLMGESIEVGGPICNINIYITSDEEIKEGDWYLDTFNTQRIKANEFSDHKHYGNACKKIIFTTDFRLAPNVQKIDDEFLEWFVNNPTCDFVEVRDIRTIPALQLGSPNGHLMYKIIIPQEELKSFSDFSDKFFGTTSQEDLLQQIITAYKIPKKYFGIEESKQETLEEAAVKEYATIHEQHQYDAFIKGAKFQAKRMYSEEEVLDLLYKREHYYEFAEPLNFLTTEDWFEQFKKK